VSRYERYATRSLVYSKWHRFYLGDNEPMIDLDAVEYCPERGCSKPLVLIETARDVGQANKPATVLRRLAEKSQILGLCVLYEVSPGTDEATGCGCAEKAVIANCDHGISAFRVRAVWPPPKNPNRWSRMTPEQFRDRLRQVRLNHFHTEHEGWGDSAA
jgi:hypothetical protein